jgi:hypothetical protein
MEQEKSLEATDMKESFAGKVQAGKPAPRMKEARRDDSSEWLSSRFAVALKTGVCVCVCV